MSNEPTPRTDANVKKHNLCRLSGNDLVYADFPRQLERELAEVTKQRDALAEALRSIKNELGVPQPEYPAPVANAVKIADKALQSLTTNKL
jgi:hypothetical protein